jgi:signal transduction histidine kinase
LGNAIKFTAKGAINVSVSLLNEEEENVTVEIKVTDSGDSATKISILKTLNKHTITSSLYGGTGLGLAIVKQLVETREDNFSKSKVDEGSTFSFTLSFQKNNQILIAMWKKNER